MRTPILVGAVLAGLGTAPVPAPGQPAGAPADVPRIAPHEVLVLGRPPAPGRPGLSPAASPLALTERARGRGLAVVETRALFPNRNAGRAFPGGAWVIRLEPGSDPLAAAARMAQDPDIAYAGPNHVLLLDPVADATDPVPSPQDPLAVAPAFTPNDSLFLQQYSLFQSNVPDAWDRSRGAGILIAIVDTGIDDDHPDLVDQVAVNAAEAAGLPGVDDDGNGLVDDVRGYDFTDAQGMPGALDYLERDPDPDDEYGHGTAVAGVAAAAFNNGIGVAGVAPEARILPLRAGYTSRVLGLTFLQEDDIAAAILYAVDRGADIINMSFGDNVEAPVMTHALEYARSQGVLLIASAGNSGRDERVVPGTLYGVVSVGATGPDGSRASFSTYGQDLDVLAAGAGIYSTGLAGSYRTYSGTSLSAPFTCGVAALVWSAHPEWTADQVAWQLRLTTQDGAGGWTRGRGWGLVGANAAVNAGGPPPVVHLESAIPSAGGGARVVGTVASPEVASWILAAASESSAVAAGDGFPADALTVAAGAGQVVAESLAVFTPPPGGTDRWILRLAADVPGRSPLTKRIRLLAPAPELSVEDPGVEPVVGEGGWDVLAHWASSGSYQGAVRAAGIQAAEDAVADHHAVRVFGPLGPGPATVQILGRPGDRSPFQVLVDTTVTVPSRERRAVAAVQGGLPPGAPMPRTVDWDGDGLPEVLLESPPVADTYGTVEWYGLSAPDSPALLGSSDGLFRGIPFDAADADGDGRPEVLVYRVDGWTVWEAPAPAAFPDQPVALPPDAQGLPVGFVDTGSGIRLLVIDGGALKAFRMDPAAGFVMTGKDSIAMPLGRPGAWGDFDDDGRLEAAFPGLNQGFTVFEVTDQAVTAEAGPDLQQHVLILHARTVAGGPDELISFEDDPYALLQPGDFTRRLSRLRRWRHDGQSLVAISDVAFAGFDFRGDVALHDLSGDLVLRRRERFDAVTVGADAMGWGETLATASFWATGSVLATFPSGDPWMWAGTSAVASLPGEGITVTSGATALGGMLQILSALTVSGGVRVELAWTPGCASESLDRSGSVRGTYALSPAGGTAADTLALGEAVTYSLSSPACPVRTLELVGRAAPLPLAASWAGPSTLVVDLPRPLRGAPGSPRPPGEVAVAGAFGRRAVRSVQVLNEGTRLWIPVAQDAPAESLFLAKTWYADGYPVGGSATGAPYVLAPRPDPAADAVLSEVRYRTTGGLRLDVVLTGGAFACPQGFVLEPGGASLTAWTAAPPDTDYTLVIPLEEALLPGAYTLRFGDACAAGRASPLGTERAFTVGAPSGPVVYPNPVPPGALLTVAGVDAGSRVEIHDLRGVPLAAFTVDGPVHRRAVTDLAPGLYFLRVEDGEGNLVAIRKLVVRR